MHWTNINIWTNYGYIRVSKFHRIWIRIYSGFKISPNMNTFEFQNFTEYEYEYIRVSKFHQIQIIFRFWNCTEYEYEYIRFQIFTECEYIWVPNFPGIWIYLGFYKKREFIFSKRKSINIKLQQQKNKKILWNVWFIRGHTFVLHPARWLCHPF